MLKLSELSAREKKKMGEEMLITQTITLKQVLNPFCIINHSVVSTIA